MIERRLSLARFGASAAVVLAGVVLLHTYVPTGMTDEFGAWSVLGLLGLFVIWLGALLGWGRILTRLTLRNAGLSVWEERVAAMGLGSVLAAAWAGITTTLGCPGAWPGTALFLVPGVLAWGVRRQRPARRERIPRSVSALSLFLVVYIVVRFVQATRLARHGDPLYYHLVAPVLWVRARGIRFDPAHPLNFGASLWEYLYLWPAQWFLGEHGKGLPAIQLFAQWTHLTLGWAGMGLVVVVLLRRLRFPPVLALLGGFAALAARTPWWTGALAKNDCGAGMWLLAGVLLLSGQRRHSVVRYATAGVLIGAAFVAKYTVAFAAVPLVLGWSILLLRRRAREFPAAVAALVVGAVVSAGPMLLRNYVGTGLPFYPVAFGRQSTACLSETTSEYLSGMSPGPVATGWSWRRDRLVDLSGEGLLAIVSVGVPLLFLPGFLRGKKGIAASDETLVLFSASFSSLLLFLIAGRPGTDFRLLGPGLVLLNVTGAMLAFLWLRVLGRAWLLGWVPAGYLTFAAIAATSHFAPEAILDRVRGPTLEREIANHSGGTAKIWAASHIAPTARIVTTGDNEIYYLLDRDVHVATDDVALDRLWRTEVAKGLSGIAILLAFRHRGFSYVLDTRFPGEVSRLSRELRPIIEGNPEWIVFQGNDASIIDLQRVARPVGER